jgi:hypothetical protein
MMDESRGWLDLWSVCGQSHRTDPDTSGHHTV